MYCNLLAIKFKFLNFNFVFFALSFTATEPLDVQYIVFVNLDLCTQWRSQDLAQEGGKPLSIIINETNQKL